ncbi:hypothetical protein BKA70DRAFT_746030 [Coprinopsis sp. MPI-PUGE-AT-0042]|nr:hypothetical protein BKA70DRAFT_746030 [Coprinopsis sp. MPI-PUGE-AT-0042]
MHVQSILNAANKAENLPVAVFKYRGKRKFLTKEKEYEETIKLVKEAFKIVQDVSFYTSTLDVCRDQFVEIDSSAYSALRAVLDEIVVVEAGSDPEDATGNRKTKARVSTTVSASSSAFSVARQLQPRGSGAATTSARTIQGPRSSLVRPQPQRTSAVHETVTRKGSTGSLDVKDYQSTSEADEREMVVAEGQDQELEYEDERAADEVNDDAAVEEPEQEEELEQLADEEEEEEDDLFGDAEEPDAEDEGAHTEEQGRRTSDEFDMVPERSYRAGLSPFLFS